MNISKKTLIASAVALALACGSAVAQSSGGNAGGNSGATQSQAGQRQSGANAGMAGSANGGMNSGANGANGMKGTTEGCANQATTAGQRVPEANRPPGTPVQGAASKGSTDWSDQANCANQQGRHGTQVPPNSGG